MKEEWLFPGAMVPVDMETTAALVAEIKRLIDVVGEMELMKYAPQPQPLTESMISAALDELEAIRQTELVGDYELIKRLLEAAHGIKEKT